MFRWASHNLNVLVSYEYTGSNPADFVPTGETMLHLTFYDPDKSTTDYAEILTSDVQIPVSLNTRQYNNPVSGERDREEDVAFIDKDNRLYIGIGHNVYTVERYPISDNSGRGLFQRYLKAGEGILNHFTPALISESDSFDIVRRDGALATAYRTDPIYGEVFNEFGGQTGVEYGFYCIGTEQYEANTLYNADTGIGTRLSEIHDGTNTYALSRIIAQGENDFDVTLYGTGNTGVSHDLISTLNTGSRKNVYLINPETTLSMRIRTDTITKRLQTGTNTSIKFTFDGDDIGTSDSGQVDMQSASQTPSDVSLSDFFSTRTTSQRATAFKSFLNSLTGSKKIIVVITDNTESDTLISSTFAGVLEENERVTREVTVNAESTNVVSNRIDFDFNLLIENPIGLINVKKALLLPEGEIITKMVSDKDFMHIFTRPSHGSDEVNHKRYYWNRVSEVYEYVSEIVTDTFFDAVYQNGTVYFAADANPRLYIADGYSNRPIKRLLPTETNQFTRDSVYLATDGKILLFAVSGTGNNPKRNEVHSLGKIDPADQYAQVTEHVSDIGTTGGVVDILKAGYGSGFYFIQGKRTNDVSPFPESADVTDSSFKYSFNATGSRGTSEAQFAESLVRMTNLEPTKSGTTLSPRVISVNAHIPEGCSVRVFFEKDDGSRTAEAVFTESAGGGRSDTQQFRTYRSIVGQAAEYHTAALKPIVILTPSESGGDVRTPTVNAVSVEILERETSS